MTDKEREERIAKGFYLTAMASELMGWGTEETYEVVAASTNFDFTIHEADIIPLDIVDGEYVRYLVKPTEYTINSPIRYRVPGC
jgi:hypothetical protein